MVGSFKLSITTWEPLTGFWSVVIKISPAFLRSSFLIAYPVTLISTVRLNVLSAGACSPTLGTEVTLVSLYSIVSGISIDPFGIIFLSFVSAVFCNSPILSAFNLSILSCEGTVICVEEPPSIALTLVPLTSPTL